MLSAVQTIEKGRFVQSFYSRDPDEIVEHVGRNLAPHRMKVNKYRDMAADLRSISLADAHLVDIQYGADVSISPEDLDNYHLVHASVSGCSTAQTSMGLFEIRPDNLHITSPGRATQIHMTKNCRHLALRIPNRTLQDYLSTVLHVAASDPVQFEPEIRPGTALPMLWRDLLSHIARQTIHAEDIMANTRVQHYYTNLLCELLLLHHRHNYTDAIRRGQNDVLPWHVRRARDLMHDSLDETVSVADIAREVGVSARSLQNGFRQFLGATPAEYIRRKRLNRLHEALRTAHPGTSVTELMLACGIVNFGRYANYYRLQYGCLPSETLRRHRLLY